uniref:Uncharacterized protein n=1 Tax=Nelumbo nucifera TaxID=4432 RepID=A0A822YF70_NELNU|nr:TPA_asm: hypothetical protein HUJ06_011675 [Nelumbo nucifera]
MFGLGLHRKSQRKEKEYAFFLYLSSCSGLEIQTLLGN